jgi:hypothetical protein
MFLVGDTVSLLTEYELLVVLAHARTVNRHQWNLEPLEMYCDGGLYS